MSRRAEARLACDPVMALLRSAPLVDAIVHYIREVMCCTHMKTATVKKLYCITSIASLITISKLFFFCSIVQNWINLIRHELAGYIRELSGFLHRTLIYFSISSLLVSNKVRTMLVFRTKGLNKNKICCQVWSQGGGSYREKIMTHFLKSAGERAR